MNSNLVLKEGSSNLVQEKERGVNHGETLKEEFVTLCSGERNPSNLVLSSRKFFLGELPEGVQQLHNHV